MVIKQSKEAKCADRDPASRLGSEPPERHSSWGDCVIQGAQFAVNNHPGLTPSSVLYALSTVFVRRNGYRYSGLENHGQRITGKL